mgnify:CR=1 FL=1|jgi:hypothetical protein
MEQFYRFDRDYNFNYVKNLSKLKKETYELNITSDTLVKNFLKKDYKKESNE